jgi:hypothetical protein
MCTKSRRGDQQRREGGLPPVLPVPDVDCGKYHGLDANGSAADDHRRYQHTQSTVPCGPAAIGSMRRRSASVS